LYQGHDGHANEGKTGISMAGRRTLAETRATRPPIRGELLAATEHGDSTVTLGPIEAEEGLTPRSQRHRGRKSLGKGEQESHMV